jgi:radical SAM/Cys-rich protein
MTSFQSAENLPANLYQVPALEPFGHNLDRRGLTLERTACTTLQINVGLLCNQTCKHCHLDAGPARQEVMTEKTVNEVINLASRYQFQTIDITGGAPEMNPHIQTLISKLAPFSEKLILRSNLTAIAEDKQDDLLKLCQTNKAAIVASFPSLNEAQAESQRGQGTFAKSLATFSRLNELGYGQDSSGLELNLVSNPTGAFLPSSQKQTEKRFRQVLDQRWGLTFNDLYAFANIPLGRFRAWLEHTGNLNDYLLKLASSFNPCAIDGLMCRSLISVSWDGYLFDCDFNQALDLHMAGRKTHITELEKIPGPGDTISVSEHCYTCTAGSGFT